MIPAAAEPVYKVTMAARSCSQYTDIFANRARNDIMESLRDLGPNTPYAPFVQVLPSVEDGLAPQSSCVPLPDWTFTFGTGIARPAPGTNLSYVTGTAAPGGGRTVVTQASTPLLDGLGNATGQSIPGATTFTLTPAELNLASQRSRFWTMGGTVTDPLNTAQFGSDYGFAALRCAADNLNGDNVEFISYPSNVRHVFCYAFYVTPPPGAGTVIIEKDVSTPLPTSAPFDFSGNLSFNQGGRFTLTVPAAPAPQVASTRFVRAETTPTTPWVVTEDALDGFSLDSITCSSTGVTTPSVATVNLATRTVNIFLQEDETVTCRFVNSIPPPTPGQGRVIKLLVGPPEGVPTGVLPTNWTFPYTPPSGPAGVLEVPATLETPSGDSGVIENLAAGDWTVSEQLPAATPGWRWEFDDGACTNSAGVVVDITIDQTSGLPTGRPEIPAGGSATCVFVNRLVPLGGLIIRLTTLGGVGTFGFVTTDATELSSAPLDLLQEATTTAPGTQVVAAGDSTNPLIGQFLVTPITPATTAAGRWVVDGLPTCNARGAPAFNIGPEQLLVSPGNAVAPILTCDYVYRLVPPSTLDLAKIILGDRSAQTGPVVISAECSDGSRAVLQVDPTDPVPARLPSLLSFLDPVTCVVVESQNGTSPPFSVTTIGEVFVDGAVAARPLNALTVGAAAASEAVEARFTNTYSDATPLPPVPPPTTPPAPILPETGLDGQAGATAWLASLTLLAGVSAVVISRTRRRTS